MYSPAALVLVAALALARAQAHMKILKQLCLLENIIKICFAYNNLTISRDNCNETEELFSYFSPTFCDLCMLLTDKEATFVKY